MRPLSDRIWTTYKSRIYTEKRLLTNAFFSEFVVALYSCYLLASSIWVLQHPSNMLSYFTIIGSVIILVISVFLSGQKFRERALAMRYHYISLRKLADTAENIEKKDIQENVNKENELDCINKRYLEKLKDIENHTEYDFLCAKINNFSDDLKYKKIRDLASFYWGKVWRYGPIVILCLLPPTFAFLLWINWIVL